MFLEEYDNLSAEDKEKLSRKASEHPRDIKKILQDLDKHKESYILIRVPNNEKPTQITISKDLVPIQDDLFDGSTNLGGKIRAYHTKLRATAQKSENPADMDVLAMRKQIHEKAKLAFLEAKCKGVIPWSRIENDLKNGTCNAPGKFEPSLTCPHHMKIADCIKLIQVLQTTPLKFIKYEGQRVVLIAKRRRQTFGGQMSVQELSQAVSQSQPEEPATQPQTGEPATQPQPAKPLFTISLPQTEPISPPLPEQSAVAKSFISEPNYQDLLQQMYKPLRVRVPGASDCFGADAAK